VNQSPDTFTETPEDLVSRAMRWEPSEHPPRETVNLLTELAQALRKERNNRATSAEIIRQQNLAYGRLELEKKTLEASVEGLVASAGTATSSLEIGTRELLKMASVQADLLEARREHARYLESRGWLARFADRIEEFFRFGKVQRLP
jgi:hypothetical protein